MIELSKLGEVTDGCTGIRELLSSHGVESLDVSDGFAKCKLLDGSWFCFEDKVLARPYGACCMGTEGEEPNDPTLIRLGWLIPAAIGIPLSKLGERHESAPGWIQNLAEQPVGGVSVIFSKAGSSRSHHWHREDSHELFVVSGEMLYLERPVGATWKPTRRIIHAGEMVFTGPGTEHSTYFPVDTVLISMSLRPRDKANHEADIVRLAEPLPIG